MCGVYIYYLSLLTPSLFPLPLLSAGAGLSPAHCAAPALGGGTPLASGPSLELYASYYHWSMHQLLCLRLGVALVLPALRSACAG